MCRVIKEITCFDEKKAICKECNSRKVRCEYLSSMYSFSGLKGHIKKSHKEIYLPSVYSAKEEACFTDEIKTVVEFIKSNPKYGEGAVSPGTLTWSETHKSDEPDYYKCYIMICKLKAKGIDVDKFLEDCITKYSKSYYYYYKCYHQ